MISKVISFSVDGPGDVLIAIKLEHVGEVIMFSLDEIFEDCATVPLYVVEEGDCDEKCEN